MRLADCLKTRIDVCVTNELPNLGYTDCTLNQTISPQISALTVDTGWKHWVERKFLGII